MKHTQDVEFVKRAIEIPNNTYDLLIDSIIDKLVSKYEKALDKACEELAMFSGVGVTSPLATVVYKYQCENCKLKNVDCNINGSVDDENCMPSKSKIYWKEYLLKESEEQ